MAECAPDAFAMANRTEKPMNVVAVIQHTSGEYLGLMEDHLEGRRIRFQYFRPFAGGRKLPAKDIPADALVLLGGGPWGSAGERDLPTLAEEIELTRAMLEQGTPVIGIGLGAQILSTLGLTQLVLLTDNPETRYLGLDAYHIEIVGTRPITKG